MKGMLGAREKRGEGNKKLPGETHKKGRKKRCSWPRGDLLYCKGPRKGEKKER